MEGLISAIQNLEASDTELATSAQVATSKPSKPSKASLPPVTLLRAITSGSYKTGVAFQALHDSHNMFEFVLGNGDLAIHVEAEVQNDRSLIQKLQADWSGDEACLLMREHARGEKISNRWYSRHEFQSLEWLFAASSTDATRYNLNGVFFSSEKEWVATDGRRLHILRNMPVLFSSGTIVQSRAIKALLATLRWIKSANVVVSESDLCVFFSVKGPTAGVEIVARKVDGRFPDYTQVIPNTADKVRHFGDAKAVANALKFAPKHGTDKGAFLALSCGGVVQALATDKKEVPLPLVTNATSSASRVDVSAKYMSEAFDGLSGSVSVWFSDGTEPVTIEQGSRLAVVMPMIK